MKKLLKFEADWCGPCKIVAPVVKKIAEQYDITVETIDTDKDLETPLQFKIRSIPTLILLEDDEEKARVTGAKPFSQTVKELGLEV